MEVYFIYWSSQYKIWKMVAKLSAITTLQVFCHESLWSVNMIQYSNDWFDRRIVSSIKNLKDANKLFNSHKTINSFPVWYNVNIIIWNIRFDRKINQNLKMHTRYFRRYLKPQDIFNSHNTIRNFPWLRFDRNIMHIILKYYVW